MDGHGLKAPIGGTYYACNNNFVWDQICLLAQLGLGPYMPTILIQKGIKYACNFSFDRDHICLQSRKFLEHLARNCLGSKSYLKKFEIAGIFGPHRDQDCTHIWSQLQALSVPPLDSKMTVNSLLWPIEKVFPSQGLALGHVNFLRAFLVIPTFIILTLIQLSEYIYCWNGKISIQRTF